MAATKTSRRAPSAAKAAKAQTPPRSRPSVATLSIGAVVLAAGAGLVAFLTRGRIAAVIDGTAANRPTPPQSEGHVPTDLLDANRNADDRAIADFRPDMSAPFSAAERAALAPATGPSPSLVEDRGSMNSQGS